MLLEHKGLLALMVMTAIPVRWDHKVVRVHKERQDRLVHQDQPEPRDHRGRQVQLDPSDLLGSTGTTVIPVRLDQQVRLVRQD